MVRLFLMRHGEAETYADSDSQRALTERGKQEARMSGQWLADEQLDQSIHGIICSPFKRAIETAQIVADAIHFSKPLEICDFITPNDDPAQLIGLLEQRAIEVPLIVCHNPLATRVACRLIDGSERGSSFPGFATGNIAYLEGEMVAEGLLSLKKFKTHY